MSEPGTKVTSECTTTRTLDGVKVEETVIKWNCTRAISVDYRVGDVALYADIDLASFDAPLADEELRDLLATYSLRGFKLAESEPSALLTEMLETAAGRLCEDDAEGIELVAAMLDAVLDDDAKAARPAIDVVRAEIAAG
jgi:hypothetical protein